MSYIAPQLTQIPVGHSVPSFLPHAVSVSLPAWSDNVAYEEGEEWIKKSMTNGYPRFFINLLIQKLAKVCAAKFGEAGEECLLVPSQFIAELCRDFVISRKSTLKPRIVEWSITPSVSLEKTHSAAVELCSVDSIDLYMVFLPAEDFSYLKQFWQHSGCGISSRFAERCLILAGESTAVASDPTPELEAPAVSTPVEPVSVAPPLGFRPSAYSRNKHYARSATAAPSLPPTPHIPALPTPPIPSPAIDKEDLDFSEDHQAYVELRYGRNLPSSAALTAKTALKRRIAGILEDDKGNQLDTVATKRGRAMPDDVYLFPTGMSAIFHAHQLAMRTREKSQVGKSVCFGFPYTDTLKIIEKWGPGAHFYGHGSAADLVTLENLLATNVENPILALFCEFPSNPLLRTPDMITLRRLADKYGFYIVIDETIGNFVNVDTLRFADILVSSLTKVFSGEPNVMGGSLVLNPSGRHYSLLKQTLEGFYEDNFFAEDALFLERNSRDFIARAAVIDDNALFVCETLRERSMAGGAKASCLKDVFYPKWSTPENYEICRRQATETKAAGGYGGLFSVVFTCEAASVAFFDALPCAKGPSLGTNFTLASPYVILAHYLELDWAKSYDVDPNLVRVAVGMESPDVLKGWFLGALAKAQEAADVSSS